MNSLQQALVDSGLANKEEYIWETILDLPREIRLMQAEIDNLCDNLSLCSPPTLEQSSLMELLTILLETATTEDETLAVQKMIKSFLIEAVKTNCQ